MITLYLGFSTIVFFLYSFLILFILRTWTTQDEYRLNENKDSGRLISILIPVRNEAKTIVRCLNSIVENKNYNFEKLEIIIVDDHSTDETLQILNGFKRTNTSKCRLKIFSLEDYKGTYKAHKKAALNYGLSKAKGEYVVQLDGDVWLTTYYLQTISSFINLKEPDFVAAPVTFYADERKLQKFQTLDMMGMMAVTQAGIASQKWYMANGANMIYKKDMLTFDDQGIASGDDIFGIQKIAQKAESKIFFLKHKDAIVCTHAEKNLGSFWNQRIRWATKNKSMQSKSMLLMMGIPFVFILYFLAHVVVFIFDWKWALVVLLTQILLKLSLDYIYLKSLNSFFKTEWKWHQFLFSFIAYNLYILSIGIASFFVKRYEWKGRRVMFL